MTSPATPLTHVGRTALLLGASLAGLTACDVRVRDGKVDLNVFSHEIKQEWSRTYTVNGGGQLEVANLDGPITIGLSPSDRVEVRAEITARARSEDGAKEMMSKGRIEEQVSADRVKVETIVPRGMRGSYFVRYDVRVPAGIDTQVSTMNGSVKGSGLTGKLKASIVNGSLDLTDMSGALDAEGVNGSVSVSVAKVTGPIRLEATNGRLELSLPVSARANLSARVVNGALHVTGLPVEESGGRGIRNLETALNGGGPQIDLRTTNGRITITGREEK
jgi:hypothetical protein